MRSLLELWGCLPEFQGNVTKWEVGQAHEKMIQGLENRSLKEILEDWCVQGREGKERG